jgi:hypothetical protein
MSITPSAIRPRSRAGTRGKAQPKDSQPRPHVRVEPVQAGNRELRPTAPSPPVLARLPEIAEQPTAKRISLNLNWLLNFQWQRRLRRLVQMEPNYLAGGVLALVVFLLVMITMRNRDGTATAAATPVSAVAATQIPTPPATVARATPSESKNKSDSVASDAPQPAATSQVPAASLATEANSGVAETIAPTPAQDPLAGIYYPRTQFGPVAGVAFEQVAGQSVAAFAAANSSAPADGVRTALRDRNEPGTPHATHTEPGVARLDGTIIRPR